MSKKPDFGKPFSKEWWGNVWYYHKVAILLAAAFGGLIVFLAISMFPQKQNLDMAFLYLGLGRFSKEEQHAVESEFSDLAIDWDEDGTPVVTFAATELNPYYDDNWNKEYRKITENIITSSTTDLFLMDRNNLRYFREREEWADLSEYAERYEIPEELLQYNDDGKLVAIHIKGHPFFEKNNIQLDFYLMLADVRTVEVYNVQDGMHEQNIAILERFLEKAEF